MRHVSTVAVSAARFRSLLANRNISVSDATAATTTIVDLAALAREDQDLTFGDIEQIAGLISRPWSYVLIDEPEPAPDYGQDNRTFENQRAELSVPLRAQLDSASRLLDDALELFPQDVYRVPLAVDSLDVETLAERMRSFLGVSNDSQLTARDGFAALRLWVDALHAQAVYVLQRRLDDPSVRAFSMIRGDHALIVVSTKDTAYARAFSAIHEYTHIALRSAGVCDLNDHSRVEKYCNQVAAGVLLPTALLGEVMGEVGSFTGEAAVDDERLIRMSRRLRVSQAALLIRLRDLGRITQSEFDTLEARRSTRRARPSGGGTFYAPAINRVSRRFARNVVGAWDEGDLDRQEASSLLGVGEHNANRFRDELLRGEAGS